VVETSHSVFVYLVLLFLLPKIKGHALAYWLKRYATTREVLGLRPDEVNGFFFSILLILSAAPGPGSVTQLLTEISTRRRNNNVSGD
jgi:hypothetical protein